MIGLRPESPVFNSAHRPEDCAPIDFSDQEVIVLLGDLIAPVCWLGLDALALRQCEVKCHVCVFDKANIEISIEIKKYFTTFISGKDVPRKKRRHTPEAPGSKDSVLLWVYSGLSWI